MSDYANLIEKYIVSFREDPKSKAFAPLGEIYRKLGLYDKALAAYENGLRFNPEYNLGIIGYSSCLIDIEDYQRAHKVLAPFKKQNGDNIKFLKNLAICSDHLGDITEALNCYKAVLFFNPKDMTASSYIKKYEDTNSSVIKKSTPLFNIENLANEEIDQWSQLSLIENEALTEIEEDLEIEQKDDSPFFSHTLVDLYIKQGAKDKALEILEKALELNPEDKKVASRVVELQEQLHSSSGHEDLMKVFDEKSFKFIEEDKNDSEKLKMALSLFLTKIQHRAKEVSP